MEHEQPWRKDMGHQNMRKVILTVVKGFFLTMCNEVVSLVINQ
jgi:hypothetical protein